MRNTFIFFTFALSLSLYTSLLGATFYKAPIGSRVRIACNGSHWNDDSVSLVLWFKGNSIERQSVPIYTVDARLKPLNNGARHFIADSYKGRAKFITKTWPPYLDLSPLEEDDQAEYRCRIDYRSKPRENFLIILFVLGRPAPAITWKWRNKVIDDSYLTLNDFLAMKQAAQLLTQATNTVQDQQSKLQPNLTSSSSFALFSDFFSSPKSIVSGAHSNSTWTKVSVSDNNLDGQKDDSKIRDNNNKKQKEQNPINQEADPSFSQLSSLFHHWRSLPEFDYFTSELEQQRQQNSNNKMSLMRTKRNTFSNSTTNVHLTLTPSSSIAAAAPAAPPAAASTTSSFELSSPSLASSNRKFQFQRKPASNSDQLTGSGQHRTRDGQVNLGQSLQQQVLLTLNVHESITTSVNVLKLTNLVSLFLTPASDIFLSSERVGQNEASRDQVKDSFFDEQQTRSFRYDNNNNNDNLDRNRNSNHGNWDGHKRSNLLPMLECQASNLHYDLRTLIKMFAPPSLRQQSNYSNESQTNHTSAPSTQEFNSQYYHSNLKQQPGSNRISAGSASFGGPLEWTSASNGVGHKQQQLISAIDSALELSLAQLATGASLTGPLGGIIHGGGRDALLSASKSEQIFQDYIESNGTKSGATALKQIKLEAGQLEILPLNKSHSTFKTNSHENVGQLSSTLAPYGGLVNDNDQKDRSLFSLEAANFIYKQLFRAHQLSSLANAAALSLTNNYGITSVETTNERQRNQQDNNQERSTLSTTKFIDPTKGKVTTANQQSSTSTGSTISSDSSAGGGGEDPLLQKKVIALDVYLRPTDVKITNFQRPLSAGQMAEFTCTSSGSKPAAKLSWWLNNRQLDSSQWRQVDEIDGSHSKLNFKLEQKDHNAVLACRSENEQLNKLNKQQLIILGDEQGDIILEDTRVLIVHFPPVKEITWLHNERPINESQLMSSKVQRSFYQSISSPTSSQEGKKDLTSVAKSESTGLIISTNNSLVLQKIRIEQRGHYACMAFNGEGMSESNRIELKVLHAPVCVTTSNTNGQLIGGDLVISSRPMSLNSKAKFLCLMEANPSDVEVSWYLNNSYTERKLLLKEQQTAFSRLSPSSSPSLELNSDSDSDLELELDLDLEKNSGESLAGRLTGTTNSDNHNNKNNEIQPSVAGAGQEKSNNKRRRSRVVNSQLNYIVDSPLDYGQLYCVAKNSIGEQKRACIYEIKPPDQSRRPLLSCLPVNVTSTSVWIACEQQLNVTSINGAQESKLEREQELELKSKSLKHSYRFTIEVYSGGNTDSNTKADYPNSSSTLSIPIKVVATDNELNEERNIISDLNDDVGSLLKNVSNYNQNYYQGKIELGSASLLERGEDGQVMNNDEEIIFDGQLEANLTSSNLNEPLFSVNNLRSQTSYTIRVYSIDTFSEQLSTPSVVKFLTIQDQATRRENNLNNNNDNNNTEEFSYSTLKKENNHHQLNNNRLSGQKQQPELPTIEPVAEPHSTDSLISAFISTRSTNRQHSLFSSTSSSEYLKQDIIEQRKQQRQQQQEKSQSALGSLWSSVKGSSLFQVLWPTTERASSSSVQQQHQHTQPMANYNKRLIAGQQQQSSSSDRARQRQTFGSSNNGNNQLMDISHETLLMTSLFLILIASLTGSLLFYRYSTKVCIRYSSAQQNIDTDDCYPDDNGNDSLEQSTNSKRNSFIVSSDTIINNRPEPSIYGAVNNNTVKDKKDRRRGSIELKTRSNRDGYNATPPSSLIEAINGIESSPSGCCSNSIMDKISNNNCNSYYREESQVLVGDEANFKSRMALVVLGRSGTLEEQQLQQTNQSIDNNDNTTTTTTTFTIDSPQDMANNYSLVKRAYGMEELVSSLDNNNTCNGLNNLRKKSSNDSSCMLSESQQSQQQQAYQNYLMPSSRNCNTLDFINNHNNRIQKSTNSSEYLRASTMLPSNKIRTNVNLSNNNLTCSSSTAAAASLTSSNLSQAATREIGVDNSHNQQQNLIPVTKSRSTFCIESLLMAQQHQQETLATASANEQTGVGFVSDKQQPPQRFIHLDSVICGGSGSGRGGSFLNRHLISDANLCSINQHKDSYENSENVAPTSNGVKSKQNWPCLSTSPYNTNDDHANNNTIFNLGSNLEQGNRNLTAPIMSSSEMLADELNSSSLVCEKAIQKQTFILPSEYQASFNQNYLDCGNIDTCQYDNADDYCQSNNEQNILFEERDNFNHITNNNNSNQNTKHQLLCSKNDKNEDRKKHLISIIVAPTNIVDANYSERMRTSEKKNNLYFDKKVTLRGNNNNINNDNNSIVNFADSSSSRQSSSLVSDEFSDSNVQLGFANNNKNDNKIYKAKMKKFSQTETKTVTDGELTSWLPSKVTSNKITTACDDSQQFNKDQVHFIELLPDSDGRINGSCDSYFDMNIMKKVEFHTLDNTPTTELSIQPINEVSVSNAILCTSLTSSSINSSSSLGRDQIGVTSVGGGMSSPLSLTLSANTESLVSPNNQHHHSNTIARNSDCSNNYQLYKSNQVQLTSILKNSQIKCKKQQNNQNYFNQE